MRTSLDKNIVEVLLVEDEPSCRMAMKTMLEFYNAQVLVASSAEEAIPILHEHPVQVVLTDIKLPGIDGLALLRQVRESYPELPVIMVTGYGSVETAVEALKLGAHDYLLKPVVDAAVLWRTVLHAAETYALLEKNRLLQEEIRRSEERFRALFHFAEDLIILFELDQNGEAGSILEANQSANEKLADPKTVLYSKKFIDLIAPEHRQTASSDLATLATNPRLEFSTVMISSRDVRIPMEVNCHILALQGKKSVIAIARDISNRLEAENRFARLIEGEKRAVGREIHDELCQDMASIDILSKAIQKTLIKEKSAALQDVELFGTLAASAAGKARNMSNLLFPAVLDTADFHSAMQELAPRMEKLYEIKIQLALDESISIPDKSISLHLYRIVQESVNNAARKGKATAILISLHREQNTHVLSIEDNGHGFHAKTTRKGLGIQIMRHRARLIHAAFKITSNRNTGTKVECRWL